MEVKSAPRTRAYVKIEDGCESKCTYCAIAAARGPVRSKAREDVIREVEALSKSGVREIVLTGIETGSYGRDFGGGYGLAELISELDARGSAERIRLGSLAPELMGREFTEKVDGCGILAPHFHISVQSGSDSVLRAMKRRYNSKMAYENIAGLKRIFPTAMFTTDLMVGFPGETEEDFQDTCDFVRKVGFLDAHVFAYSRREGTPAAYYENQIPEEVKRSRSERLIALKNEVRDAVLDDVVRVGRPISVILETERGGVYTGHSDSFIEVSVEAKGGLKGEIVDVLPVGHKDGVIFGKIAKI
jgi:threonylcarbamoyladenosine tRNA methylthiotransferase MtaB